MHHDFLDKYSRLDSPVHEAPAAIKLATAIFVVLGIVVAPIGEIAVFASLALGLAAVTLVSRVPVRFLLGRLLLLEPLVAGLALMALLQPNGGMIALRIVVKSTLSLATMLLLANTTPFAELLRVLRHLRVPALFITVLALMYRYLFLLVDEAERMQRARASRTFTHTRARLWRSSATLVGQLFVRSSERAERIYAAMCARGWR